MPEIHLPDDLINDCGNCQGLCCVALVHKRSEGFPIFRTKPVGEACRHLEVDPASQANLYKCRIHAELPDTKWQGCENYSCYGAGQTISKFFEELGISWAMKPLDESDPKWQLMVKNLYASFIIFHKVFERLHDVKYTRSPTRSQTYMAVREAVIKVAQELATHIQSTEEVIDYNFWLESKFHPAMRGAVTNSSIVPASRLSGRSRS